ncbi:MAG: hypothetical protein HRU03_03335 [Nanoarchaeales archaeon]|nr:hypothetical protein [Nanoarchaeales archaeon]
MCTLLIVTFLFLALEIVLCQSELTELSNFPVALYVLKAFSSSSTVYFCNNSNLNAYFLKLSK